MNIENGADLFLKYNYTETKDLCKAFLTLITAVLVFSLTFSEKIVGFANVGAPSRVLMVLAWALMIIAIITCGIGLTFNALAGGAAVYGRNLGRNYLELAAIAYKWIIAAGFSFVLALISLTLTACFTVWQSSGR